MGSAFSNSNEPAQINAALIAQNNKNNDSKYASYKYTRPSNLKHQLVIIKRQSKKLREIKGDKQAQLRYKNETELKYSRQKYALNLSKFQKIEKQDKTEVFKARPRIKTTPALLNIQNEDQCYQQQQFKKKQAAFFKQNKKKIHTQPQQKLPKLQARSYVQYTKCVKTLNVIESHHHKSLVSHDGNYQPVTMAANYNAQQQRKNANDNTNKRASVILKKRMRLGYRGNQKI